MSKILRIILYCVGLIALLLLIGAGFIYFRGIPSYKVQSVVFKVHPTPEKLERGLKLVATLCAGCHLDKKTNALSGQALFDSPPEFGKIYAANITKDVRYGIGNWTDSQIAYLLRTGVKPDGRFIPPYMPKLVQASDEDIESIIVFLRSDHSLVKAQAIASTLSQPSFLTKFLSHTVKDFQPLAYPTKVIQAPDTTRLLEYGEYLINLYGCYACHSNNFQTLDVMEPRKSKGYFGGGNLVYNMKGEQVIAPNLTPDKATGLGTWTEKVFGDAVRYGKNPRGGKALQYPMLPYNRLTDSEIKAIFGYLKTIPAIHNKVR